MKAIRMLVGQEGPEVSRVRGQVLTIGADVDAAEAQRLVDATFAEDVGEEAIKASPPAKPKTPAKKPA